MSKLLKETAIFLLELEVERLGKISYDGGGEGEWDVARANINEANALLEKLKNE